MIEVRIPAALRDDADGVSVVSVEEDADCTVADVLHLLFAQFPRLRTRILDDAGAVRRFVNVFVGESEVGRSLTTAVPSGSTVYVFQSIAGGAE